MSQKAVSDIELLREFIQRIVQRDYLSDYSHGLFFFYILRNTPERNHVAFTLCTRWTFLFWNRGFNRAEKVRRSILFYIVEHFGEWFRGLMQGFKYEDNKNDNDDEVYYRFYLKKNGRLLRDRHLFQILV